MFHEDFLKVTGDALDYSAEQMHLELTSETRARLLNAYLTLKPWLDTVAALKKLKAAGVRIITIANFSPTMLRANADNAGITNLFDELLSTEVNRFTFERTRSPFAAFGGWDAYGAKRFGYATVWVNRFNLPTEKLGTTADRITTNMDGVIEFVLGASHAKEMVNTGPYAFRWPAAHSPAFCATAAWQKRPTPNLNV